MIIPKRKPRTVADLIAEARGGLTASAISADLARVIAACEISGKPGEITIKLKVVPHGKDNREIHIHTTHKANVPYDPELARENIYFIAGPAKDLVRDDPETPQQDFGLRGVDSDSPTKRLEAMAAEDGVSTEVRATGTGGGGVPFPSRHG